ncbi:MAG: hypothetical protein IJ702_07075 [Fretibacterium sp.]|nr:hypothetical protein [Fretibacterium sp.]
MREIFTRQELNYVRIGDALGGNQDWLQEWDMNRGGCGAVTACDLCIYLAAHEGFPALYPYDLEHLSQEDFIRFSQVMKPYLAPRYHGIDFLETYIAGLLEYWRSVGYAGPWALRVEGLSGTVPYAAAEALVRTQIDAGLPVPCLTLEHNDPALGDLEWHWFNLAGYEEAPDGLLVQVVTYGEGQWFSLRRLWETGRERRGGLIRLFRRQAPSWISSTA